VIATGGFQLKQCGVSRGRKVASSRISRAGHPIKPGLSLGRKEAKAVLWRETTVKLQLREMLLRTVERSVKVA